MADCSQNKSKHWSLWGHCFWVSVSETLETLTMHSQEQGCELALATGRPSCGYPKLPSCKLYITCTISFSSPFLCLFPFCHPLASNKLLFTCFCLVSAVLLGIQEKVKCPRSGQSGKEGEAPSSPRVNVVKPDSQGGAEFPMPETKPSRLITCPCWRASLCCPS